MSTTFILPSATLQQANDDALIDLLQSWFAGLANLPGTMVRPNWQEDPPPQPERNQDWLAIGIRSRRRDFDTFTKHISGDPTADPPIPGYDATYRNEILILQCRAYGPNSDAIAASVWNNAQLGQNRALLLENGMGLVRVEDPHQAADFVKERWVRVIDFEVHLRRAIALTYPVLDLESASIEIISDVPPFTTTVEIELDE